jgi:D-glycero-D-manno-heptose 1,7-bisphosphate phosphatase
MKPAIFLDKDGTVIVDVPYNVDLARIELQVGCGEALRRMQRLGYALVVVSNQSGVARGYFSLSAVGPVEQHIRQLLAAEGVSLSGFYFCPHFEHGAVQEFAVPCECRKPRPGMLLTAARELSIDLERSWMIGDILDDVEAGHRADCAAILLDNGGETIWDVGDRRRWPDFVTTDLLGAAEFIADAGTHGEWKKRVRHAV